LPTSSSLEYKKPEQQNQNTKMMQNVEKITIPEIFVSRDDVQTDNLNRGRGKLCKSWEGSGGNVFSAKALS
jgi:uncharacterized protein YukE